MCFKRWIWRLVSLSTLLDPSSWTTSVCFVLEEFVNVNQCGFDWNRVEQKWIVCTVECNWARRLVEGEWIGKNGCGLDGLGPLSWSLSKAWLHFHTSQLMSQCHTISVTLWKEYSGNITPSPFLHWGPSHLVHLPSYLVEHFFWVKTLKELYTFDFEMFVVWKMSSLFSVKLTTIPFTNLLSFQHCPQRGGACWKLQLGLPPWLGAPVSAPCTCLPGEIQTEIYKCLPKYKYKTVNKSKIIKTFFFQEISSLKDEGGSGAGGETRAPPIITCRWPSSSSWSWWQNMRFKKNQINIQFLRPPRHVQHSHPSHAGGHPARYQYCFQLRLNICPNIDEDFFRMSLKSSQNMICVAGLRSLTQARLPRPPCPRLFLPPYHLLPLGNYLHLLHH